MSLRYLEQFESKSTVRAYRAALKKFFQVIYGVEEFKLEEYAEKYLKEKRNFENDVQTYMIALKEAPPKTRRLYLTAVKIFLLENGIELSQLFWRRLRGRIKGSGAISEEKVPNKDQLRSLFMHLPVHGKALFLTLLSSGMRIGEALKLKVSDVDLTQQPATVYIRAEYTKTGEKRIAFISSEAAEAIREWLKVRGEYLEAATGKSHIYGKKAEDDRLFPFSSVNARVMWRNALNKTGNGAIDPKTRRLMMRPHVLRKFFRAMLGRQSVDMTEALMGHSGYLTEVYRKYPDPEKTLADFYRQNEHLLLIFADTSNIIKKQSELEQQNKQLQQILNGLVAENMELKNRLQKTEEKLAEIERLLREFTS